MRDPVIHNGHMHNNLVAQTLSHDTPISNAEDISLIEDKCFSSLGINKQLLTRLGKIGITVPTKIQQEAIPFALENRDIVGIAQTGTGKTLAFAIPLVQKLMSSPGNALILAPTRELALQIDEQIRLLTASLSPRISTAAVIGGASMQLQFERLSQKPRIIIATPGRLQDHLNRKTVNLSNVSTVVLDEADRMFDMGFAPQMKKFLELIPAERQVLLFSATMPPEVASLVNKHLRDPSRIEIARAPENTPQIEQQICYVDQSKKADILEKLLSETEGLVIVFTRTKFGAKDLSNRLYDSGYRSAEIHSNRSQSQRKRALDGFKSGRYRVLVATDVAARGIDVDDIKYVVNFDLPDSPEDYVHRIGRTGRAGKSGIAISFATQKQQYVVKIIEKLVKSKLELSQYSAEPNKETAQSKGGNRQGGRSSGGRGRDNRSRDSRSRDGNRSSGERDARRSRGRSEDTRSDSSRSFKKEGSTSRSPRVSSERGERSERSERNRPARGGRPERSERRTSSRSSGNSQRRTTRSRY